MYIIYVYITLYITFLNLGFIMMLNDKVTLTFRPLYISYLSSRKKEYRSAAYFTCCY